MTLLSELKIGQEAVIDEIQGTDSISMRLMEMGLLPGETISMTGRAPLGDPLEFQVTGIQLSLRKGEANRIHVRPVEATSP